MPVMDPIVLFYEIVSSFILILFDATLINDGHPNYYACPAIYTFPLESKRDAPLNTFPF
jgi:hypothetical protein